MFACRLRLLLVIVTLAVVSTNHPVIAWAAPLSRDDLVSLIKLQVGDAAIVAKIEKDGIGFQIDQQTIDRLKLTGASDTVLAAVRNARSVPVLKSWLGVSVRHSHGGLIVENVIPTSPAALGGLMQGDHIAAIDGRNFRVPADFTDYVSSKPSGAVVRIDVRRDEKLLTFDLQLAARPSSGALFQQMLKQAEGGDARAQYQLAQFFALGIDTEKNEAEAVKWHRRAAEQGHAAAQWATGLAFRHGWGGLEKSESDAASWLRKSGDQGFAPAQLEVGLLYLDGVGVAKDETAATKWLRAAAEQDYQEAQYQLGLCCLNGEGIQQNDAEALDWFKRAAEAGYAPAQNSLGWMHASARGVPENFDEAIRWYRMAADAGLHTAQFNLGRMYESGRGVPQNQVDAVKWYELAARQNFSQGQFHLGRIYAEGKGVGQSYESALVWLRLAAGQNDAPAQHYLGWMYQHGKGVAQDRDQAIHWYRKAAAQGYEAAKQSLEELGANP